MTARRFHNVVAEARRASGKAAVRTSLLYFLEESPKGLTQTELAGRLDISGPSLTRQLDKLEGLGFVSRRRMIGDGRVRLVMIEPAGREALLELDVLNSEMRDRIFGDIPQADLETAQRVLDTLAARLAVDPGLVMKPSSSPRPGPPAPLATGTGRR
ncbi:MAG: MarR family winged helix-turn-helix transcriptional regulator [Brevundimonas sp.]